MSNDCSLFPKTTSESLDDAPVPIRKYSILYRDNIEPNKPEYQFTFAS